jgi:hypothetical protein
MLPAAPSKKLTISADIIGGVQDLTEPLSIRFSNPIKSLDSNMFSLLDSNNKRQACKFRLDSSRKKLLLEPEWNSDAKYSLVTYKARLEDSSGNKLTANDTISFQTRPISYYGRVVLRFTNFMSEQHPVAQLILGEEVKFTRRLAEKSWSETKVPPGEYMIRVFFDSNNNGIWDTGDFSKKQQPEKSITISQKLTVRSDWDNERDISY